MTMSYPFMTLNDDTEIVHSETLPDGRVKVYMETPDDRLGFRHATCYLPGYEWEDVKGYTSEQLAYLMELIESTSHLILKYARCGGYSHAASV